MGGHRFYEQSIPFLSLSRPSRQPGQRSPIESHTPQIAWTAADESDHPDHLNRASAKTRPTSMKLEAASWVGLLQNCPATRRQALYRPAVRRWRFDLIRVDVVLPIQEPVLIVSEQGVLRPLVRIGAEDRVRGLHDDDSADRL